MAKVDGHRRSGLKTLSWRLTAFTSDSIIIYLVTHQVVFSTLIGGLTGVVKLFRFYGHERIWARVKWGRH